LGYFIHILSKFGSFNNPRCKFEDHKSKVKQEIAEKIEQNFALENNAKM
jgi:hypothetical protein